MTGARVPVIGIKRTIICEHCGEIATTFDGGAASIIFYEHVLKHRNESRGIYDHDKF
jgi:hypothetical protein